MNREDHLNLDALWEHLLKALMQEQERPTDHLPRVPRSPQSPKQSPTSKLPGGPWGVRSPRRKMQVMLVGELLKLRR